MAKRKRGMTAPTDCHCGSGDDFVVCCRPVHLGARRAETAEALMRARYSAYVTGNEQFLLDSWHPDTRPLEVRFDGGQKWLGLTVVVTDAGSAFESVGQVEFRARFSVDGMETALHERSSFVRLDGSWVYVDGELL